MSREVCGKPVLVAGAQTAMRVVQVIKLGIVQPDVWWQKVPVLRQETLDGPCSED